MGTLARAVAPAKLNLHLQIIGRRSDGYHDLISLFQAISLRDDIAMEAVGSSDKVIIEGDFDCPPEKNTMAHAVERFRLATGIREGVRITAVKRIPSGAGLGGGSSDAASVLLLLNAVFETDLGVARLAEIGLFVGSDVPFFLGHPCSLVSGRGERVVPVQARLDLVYLVVYPGFPVSTKGAYESWDREYGKGLPSLSRNESDRRMRKIVEVYSQDPASWDFENSFYTVLRGEYPRLECVIADLERAGAIFASLSGSGSACFGVFPSITQAETAVKVLRAKWTTVITAIPLARSAEVVLE